jgi:hypothetical protein
LFSDEETSVVFAETAAQTKSVTSTLNRQQCRLKLLLLKEIMEWIQHVDHTKEMMEFEEVK